MAYGQATLKLSPAIYGQVSKVKAEMEAVKGRPVTFSEAVERLVEEHDTRQVNIVFTFLDERQQVVYDVHPRSQNEGGLPVPAGAVAYTVWMGTRD